MGIIDSIKSIYHAKMEEIHKYESRGLDEVMDTPEVRSHCIKKVKWLLFSAFARPMIFSVIAWAVVIYVLVADTGYDSITEFGTMGLVAFGFCCVFVPGVAALIYFQHLGSVSSGKFELYGGMCISRQNGEKDAKGYTRYSAKMNGVWLTCESYALNHVDAGVYYYVLRIKTRKKATYFFVETTEERALANEGNFYPND